MAIANWREGLATTAEGLRGQNQIIADMDTTANGMITNAGALNDLFTSDADRIGQAVRTILVLGAAIGLLLGAGDGLHRRALDHRAAAAAAGAG